MRTLPGYDWPPLAEPALAQVWVAYLELERTQWLTAAEVERRQLEQVRSLLVQCVTEVPYYREVLPGAGVTPGAIQSLDDFRRVPLLPRQTYQEKFTAFAAARLPPGTVATRTQQTSGSSGTPTTVLQTNLVHLWWFACFLRDLEWSGVCPSGKLAAIRSTGQKGARLAQLLTGTHQSCWMAELEPLLVTGPLHLMDVQQDHREQWRWLRAVAPDYLLSYPSNLEVLASFARQDGPLPGLRAIQSVSETLTEDVRAEVESAFGVPVRNTYSCAEAGYLASPCPQGHGLHVHGENVLLEVLDEDGRPCAPGQTGRVYITSLNNFRGPLLRYDLGDRATWGGTSCPCGRGLPLLTRVEGKSPPMFRLPDGRLKSSVTLARLVRKVGGHRQHQVVQKAPDHVLVRLAVDSTWTDRHAAELRQQLQAFFEAPVRVDLEVGDRLARPASGKFQSMVSELAPPPGKET